MRLLTKGETVMFPSGVWLSEVVLGYLLFSG